MGLFSFFLRKPQASRPRSPRGFRPRLEILETRLTPSITITEFSNGLTSNNSPSGITAGPDGNLWFTDNGSPHAIGRITTAGAITEFSSGIPSNSNLLSITTGPDGDLWFTDNSVSAPAIGRITTAGVVTMFSTGLPTSSAPTYITTGPDGNLWFTESGELSAIGRITTAGVITLFTTGITSNSFPFGITAGPDGNLWFTEQLASRIGRITTAGVITEFSNGITANGNPDGITVGPDGNLWFPLFYGNKIDRITTAGVVTEFNASTIQGQNIVTGPDGNLWLTTSIPSIIEMTTAGAITVYGSPNYVISGAGLGITKGPDNNLWFTEPSYHKIAVIQGFSSAPNITSANSTTFTVGQFGTFPVTATGSPTPTFSETGNLPGGVTLSTVGTLSGTPAAGSTGSYPITITASNGVGTPATQNFTLIVTDPPASITATSGTAQSTTIETSFTTPFQVVVNDSAGYTEGAGIDVAFTVFSSSLGAGATFAGDLTTVTVATDAGGIATVPTLTADGVGGTYTLTASIEGIATPVTWTLSNTLPNLPFSDNFQSSAGPLNSANWQTMTASNGFQPGGFTQNGNGLAVANSTAVNIADYIGASAVDVSITAAGITLAGSGSEAGVVARNNGTSFYLAAVFDNNGTYLAQIYIVHSFGNFSTLGSVALGALTQPFNLTFNVQGTALQLLVNSTLELSVLDGSLTTPGEAGLWATPVCSYTSFTATALVPSLPFSGTFTGAAGPLSASSWQTMPASNGFQPGGFTQNGNGLAVANSTAVNIADYIGASTADVSITATGITLAGSGSEAGVVARNNGTSLYLAGVYNSAGTYLAQIYIVHSFGNFSTLGSVALGVLTQPFNLTFNVQGTALQLLVNSTLELSVLDGSLTTPGEAGLWATPVCSYTSFTATALVPSLPFSGTFTGAAGPLSASSWQTMPASNGFQPGGFTQNGNGLAVANSTAVNIADYIGASTADVSITATGITLAGSGSEAGVVARNNGTSFYLAAVFDNNGTYLAQIYIVHSFGNFSTLGSVALGALTQPFNLTFNVQGPSLELLVNGTVELSLLDSSLTTPGVVGLWATPNPTYTSFTATALVPSLPFSGTFTGAAGPLNPAQWQTMPASNGFQPGGFTQNGSGLVVAGSTAVNIADYTGASAADVSITASGISLAGSGSEAGVVARNNGTSFYLAAVFDNNGVFTAYVYLIHSFGNYTTLGSASLGSLTQPFNLTFNIQGTSLQLFVNNSLEVSLMDNTLTTSGVAGLWATPNDTFSSFTIAAL